MDEIDLLNSLKIAEKQLGFDSRQFSGAVVVNLIKKVVSELGFSTSEKDVFIRGIPIEIDFLIVKPRTFPDYGILWKAEDVIAAFEMKKSGIISREGRIKVNSDFHRIKNYYPDIRLFYVTFSETRDKLEDIQRSDDSFTFFIRRNGKFSVTGDFERFIKIIRQLAVDKVIAE